MLSINIRDVHIHKLLSKAAPGSSSAAGDDLDRDPTPSHDHHNTTDPAAAASTRKRPFDFRHRKVPPSIMTFAQFIAVHVHHIAVTVASDVHEPNWRMHATVQELHLDGSIVQNAKSLIVTAALNDARAKLLRRLGGPSTTTSGPFDTIPSSTATIGFSPLKVWPATAAAAPVPTETCLVELCFGISLDGVILAHAQPSLEKFQLNMNHTRTTVHDALFDFVRDMKAAKAAGVQSNRSGGMAECLSSKMGQSEVADNGDNLYARISPIIPKVSVNCVVEFFTIV